MAIREIPLSLQVSLSIFFSRLEDEMERCEDQKRHGGEKRANGRRKVTRAKERRNYCERKGGEAKNKSQCQSHQ